MEPPPSAVASHRRRSPDVTSEHIAERIVAEFVRDASAIGAAGGAIAAAVPGSVARLTGGTVTETSAHLERAFYRTRAPHRPTGTNTNPSQSAAMRFFTFLEPRCSRTPDRTVEGGGVMATDDAANQTAKGEPSTPRLPSSLVEVLLLGELFAAKQPAPMVDLSATWAIARRRWRDRNGDSDVGPSSIDTDASGEP
ncbi:hypothetical protein [Nocardioides abyssi]|uniref:Uncharacterized protein n=1 Tax=Nocardioides abyssi TaxID=3058370 RepID=A0ABT8ESF4_9ACTN|nr:hypothetical protein [Nocardioides abyssi]MDN4161085.1 hypothetical protein [Nocardioides abyssi]